MVKFERVILITVDCLRADHVGCISGGNLTPNIDKFAENSIVFTRAFANGPGTNQSFPAILTSTYFLVHEGLRLNPYCVTLAEVLRSNGFKTVAFHSNPFLSKIFGWDRGFDEFYDFMNVTKGPSAFVARKQKGKITKMLMRFVGSVLGASYSAKIQRLLKKAYYKFSGLRIPYLEGSELNKYVIEWFKKNKEKRFFLWVHYMDPHDPYVPPEEYLPSNFASRDEAFEYNLAINTDKPSKEDLAILKRLYEGEVKYVDTCICELIHFLEDKGFVDDSLMIFTADHGHAFMEHGRFAHAYDILYNEVTHVPLIIHGVGKAKIDTFVQLLDLPPTVLDLLGINCPPTFMGRSLLKKMKGPSIIFSESAKPDLINLRYDVSKKAISCIKDEYKFILNQLRGTMELYNLEKDFQEINDLSEKEKELCSNMLSLIEKHLLHESTFKTKIKLLKTIGKAR